MLKIKTTYSEKFSYESFVHIEKNTGRVKKGEAFIFVDWSSEYFLTVAHCISVENISIDQLKEHHCYLAENCNVEMFERILHNRNIGKTEMLTVGYFTKKNNIKSLNLPPKCENSSKINSSSSPQKSLKKIP